MVVATLLIIVEESLAFGTVGCLLFRILKFDLKWKYLEIAAVFIILLLYNFGLLAIIKDFDISIGNEDVMAFLDNDLNKLLEFDYWDFVIVGIQTMLGYYFGLFVYKKLTKSST